MVSVVLKKRIHVKYSLKFFNSGFFFKPDHTYTARKREAVVKLMQHFLLSNTCIVGKCPGMRT